MHFNAEDRDYFWQVSHHFSNQNPKFEKKKLALLLFQLWTHIYYLAMGKRKGSVDQSSSRHVKLSVVEKQAEVETPYLGNWPNKETCFSN
jgi:hypothetical protein